MGVNFEFVALIETKFCCNDPKKLGEKRILHAPLPVLILSVIAAENRTCTLVKESTKLNFTADFQCLRITVAMIFF